MHFHALFNVSLLYLMDMITELSVAARGIKPQIDEAKWISKKVVHNVTSDKGYTSHVEFEMKIDELPE